VLERAIYELYDHHCGLRTNNKISRHVVPTATDIWAEYRLGKPVVAEVRKGFGAEKAGVRAGMEIIAINDQPVDAALKPFLSHVVNEESKSFALRLALAGNHISARKFTLKTVQNSWISTRIKTACNWNILLTPQWWRQNTAG
jgi:C-terminal processing protease CtpA/Prc